MMLNSPSHIHSLLDPARFMRYGSGPGGGAVANSAEVQQFFERLAPEPDTALAADYAAFIDGCVAAGIWDLIENVQALAVDHEGQAVVNLKSNTANGNPEYGLGGTLTWTANRGYSSTGLAQYSTEFDPSAASIFAQNSGFVGMYSLTSAQVSQPAIYMGPSGSSTQNDKIALYPKWSDNVIVGSIASSAAYASVNIGAASSAGWMVLQRTLVSGPGAFELRKDGDSLAFGSVVSAAYTSGEKVKLKCRHQTAFFVAGGALSEAQHDALWALVVAFLTGRGAI